VKLWHKILVVFVGCGLASVCVYCASIWPNYALLLSLCNAICLAVVATLTGFKSE